MRDVYVRDSVGEETEVAPELSASLIENVQFIYELALAELELEAFGVNFRVTNSMREFVASPPIPSKLVERLAYFKTVGQKATHYHHLLKYNRTRSVNQYLTHWIYPYKGKFHPQMIRALLNILKLEANDFVLDPFIGSGTTAVEAQLLGINCIGIDVSPLCVLQSKVKTESIYAIDEIRRVKDEAIAAFRLTTAVRGPYVKKGPAEDYDTFLNSIEYELVKNFYLMAKLVAVSERARRGRDIVQSFIKNLEQMVSSVEDYVKVAEELSLHLGNVDIREGDARHLPLEDGSVQGIVTSPPYSIALDYVANDAHAFKAMGYDPNKIREDFVGVRGKGKNRIKLYNEDITESLREMYRVLERGRCCAIIVGNAKYQKAEVKTIEFTIEQCQKLGFTLIHNINKIIYGLYNVMQTDNTLIFRKDR